MNQTIQELRYLLKNFQSRTGTFSTLRGGGRQGGGGGGGQRERLKLHRWRAPRGDIPSQPRRQMLPSPCSCEPWDGQCSMQKRMKKRIRRNSISRKILSQIILQLNWEHFLTYHHNHHQNHHDHHHKHQEDYLTAGHLQESKPSTDCPILVRTLLI